MKAETVLDFQIAAIRQCMEDLKYERKHLQRQMTANRQRMAECRHALKEYEERRKQNARVDESHADDKPASVMG